MSLAFAPPIPAPAPPSEWQQIGPTEGFYIALIVLVLLRVSAPVVAAIVLLFLIIRGD